MIHRVFSDLPSFKTIEFSDGFNLLLADRMPDATRRQTRNGAGKTSLIELFHFLLGGNADPRSMFRTSALAEHTFSMTADLGGSPLTFARSGDQPSKVCFTGPVDDSGWPIGLDDISDPDHPCLSNAHWRALLGALVFDVPTLDAPSNGPTFRSLISYLIRREAQGAFHSPFKQFTQQSTFDWQVALSFFLGLDWSVPQELEGVRQREKTLKQVQSAARTGALGDLFETVADLRTKVAVANRRADRLREDVRQFNLLPQYEELESEATTLDRGIARRRDEIALDRALIADIEAALEAELPPDDSDLADVYRQAGVVLGQDVVRRYEDVAAFHRSVIANRASYLRGEINAARQRLDTRESRLGRDNSRRAEILQTLSSHGALDQLNSLQREVASADAQVAELKGRMAVARRIEGDGKELELERTQLSLRLQQDIEERSSAVESLIAEFREISSSLYESPGDLEIGATDNGVQPNIAMASRASRGISSMALFCFDMAIASLLAERGTGPRILVHDSHLFDGVDTRQVATALEEGASRAERYGFQYIVTLNSDSLPADWSTGFSVDDYILPVRLTDATEDGGLFGIRF